MLKRIGAANYFFGKVAKKKTVTSKVKKVCRVAPIESQLLKKQQSAIKSHLKLHAAVRFLVIE